VVILIASDGQVKLAIEWGRVVMGVTIGSGLSGD
jgi:hypothetical protein